jgi:integrase
VPPCRWNSECGSSSADLARRRRTTCRNGLRAVYAAGDTAGLNTEGVEKVGLHDLRHSCAGLLFAANVPAPTIAAILRHVDVRTTLTVYAGLVETNRARLRCAVSHV